MTELTVNETTNELTVNAAVTEITVLDDGTTLTVDETVQQISITAPPEAISVVGGTLPPPRHYKWLTASENLSAGDFVNVWSDSGSARMRKADATSTGQAADGFVLVDVTSGDSAKMHVLGQINDQVSGLTIGTLYYLDTTAGAITATKPNASGNIIQRLGRAVSATNLETGDYLTIEVA